MLAFPLVKCCLHRRGSLSSISGPERPRQPPYLREHSASVGDFTKWSNHSDIFSALQTFDLLQPDRTVLWFSQKESVNFSIRRVFFFCFLCLFFSSLSRFVSRSSSVLSRGTYSVIFQPLNKTSFPVKTFFFHPLRHPCLLHCFATNLLLLPSFSFPPFFPPSLFFPPRFISRFSWTPSMRYAIYRHRYGRLSLLTVSTLIPSRPLPVSVLTLKTSRRAVCCSVGCMY